MFETRPRRLSSPPVCARCFAVVAPAASCDTSPGSAPFAVPVVVTLVYSATFRRILSPSF